MDGYNNFFTSQQQITPYIIPIIDIDRINLTTIIKKVSQFNEIVRLVKDKETHYTSDTFISNIHEPTLHKTFRTDFIQTLEIIFSHPDRSWYHKDNEVVECITNLKKFFEPFQYRSGLLFESSTGSFDWLFLCQNGTTVPYYFFECMRILFGIQCLIPNTGTMMRQSIPLTAHLTNHGGHFSIGSQSLLTPTDGNCFFHLHCQFITGLYVRQSLNQHCPQRLLDLTYSYAIKNKNDNLVRFLYNIQNKDNLYSLLITLFEDHIRDIHRLDQQKNMADLTKNLIANFFNILIREHHISSEGKTYLKKTYGMVDTICFIDIFIYNDDIYISGEKLGEWKVVTSYKDYLIALTLLWHPTLTQLQVPTTQNRI
ncbi:MAG: hypothetical protein VX835_01420 [Pseudomonadota bacterium]|nr:hypothetical protein [Pseudomonadota bacterium]